MSESRLYDLAPSLQTYLLGQVLSFALVKRGFEPVTRGLHLRRSRGTRRPIVDQAVPRIGAPFSEIARGQPMQLVKQPLIKAQAKEYVRQSQERLIGEPVLQHLKAESGDAGVEQLLLALCLRAGPAGGRARR